MTRTRHHRFVLLAPLPALLTLAALLAPAPIASGATAARCDFDGDGRSDLASGVRNESIGGALAAGSVQVLQGGGNGLSARGNELWHQNDRGVPGIVERGDLFGAAVACGDIDGDGFGELIVGAPGESVGGDRSAGAVTVLYGSGNGLRGADSQILHQDVPRLKGLAQSGDQYGESVASGDFNNDGYADIAVGVPGETVDGREAAGAVHLLYGSRYGIVPRRNRVWHQNWQGVVGRAEARNFLGEAVAAGDFDRDGFDDLAVGVPGERFGQRSAGGAVQTFKGSSRGIVAPGNDLWHQGDLQGRIESFDRFGNAVATGDFDGDGFADVAAGVPGESIKVRVTRAQ